MRCLNHKGLMVGILFFLVAALAAPATAGDGMSEPTAPGMIFDLVVIRPVSLVMTAVGTVFFVASLPLTVWSGHRISTAGRVLVGDPAHFTFVRPLGEFPDNS